MATDTMPRITTPCPTCGERALFIGVGGHLTCGWLKCRNPSVGFRVQELQQVEQVAKSLLRAMRVTPTSRPFSGSFGDPAPVGLTMTESEAGEYMARHARMARELSETATDAMMALTHLEESDRFERAAALLERVAVARTLLDALDKALNPLAMLTFTGTEAEVPGRAH